MTAKWSSAFCCVGWNGTTKRRHARHTGSRTIPKSSLRGSGNRQSQTAPRAASSSKTSAVSSSIRISPRRRPAWGHRTGFDLRYSRFRAVRNSQRRKETMSRHTFFPLIAFFLSALAVNATAEAAPRAYWTPAQANAAVIAQASIPYCKIFECVDGAPRSNPGHPASPLRITSASCRGVSGYGKAGRFSRFTCSYTALNDLSEGTLQVFTAGPSRIRWRRV